MNQKEYELVGDVLYRRRVNAVNLDKLGWSKHDIEIAVSIIDDLVSFMAHEMSLEYTNFDYAKFEKICRGGKA